MNCSVCNRDLAPDWSVCPKCGAMKNDSVREELEQSLTPIATPIKFRFADEPAVPVAAERVTEVEPPTLSAPVMEHVMAAEPPPPPVEKVERRTRTCDLPIKKTSPTLAEFKTPTATVPEWRLQLQNSIRQRTGRASVAVEPVQARPATATSGANALKVKYEEEPTAEKDERVANALKRIEQSRRTYLPGEKARQGIRVAQAAKRNFPFNVVARSGDTSERLAQPVSEKLVVPVEAPAPVAEVRPVHAARPKLISSLKIEKKSYDTNKLVPIPEAQQMAAPVEEVKKDATPAIKRNVSQRIEIRFSDPAEGAQAAIDEPIVDNIETQSDDLDDLAPISMRFNSGLFDLIIGAFATFILLSPFLAFSEGWVSFSGFLLFASVLFVVMFVYLTAAIAFLGQTFGMKLFSLELVDIEQSEFPTLHQAAVNSSVYLLSLLFGGLGFVPILFNEEKRAAHDLVSGTILVREV